LLIGAFLAYVQLNHFNALNYIQTAKAFRFSEITIYTRDIASLVGLVLIVAAIFLLSEKSSFPGVLALIPTVGATMLIAAGQDSWINKHLLSHKWMVSIGLISYPLYLWHWPLFTFARMTPSMIEYPRIIIISLVGLALFLSYLTYVLVEKPLRYGFKKKTKTVTLYLMGGLTIVASLGYWTTVDGLENRYPETARQLLSFKYGYDDYKENFRNEKCLLSGTQQEFADECSGERGGKSQYILIWGEATDGTK
jgi:peptidoglycan/LPS O-acetylase OafA/YrhL